MAGRECEPMTHRTILLHRGGFGPKHKFGEIEIRPEGTDCHGDERHYVRLSILGDAGYRSCSCPEERLDEIIAEYTAAASHKETYVERMARLRREAERRAKKRKLLRRR